MNDMFQLADSAPGQLFLEESFAARLHAEATGWWRHACFPYNNAMPLDGEGASTLCWTSNAAQIQLPGIFRPNGLSAGFYLFV